MADETPSPSPVADRSIGGPLISLADKIPEAHRADAGRILSRLNGRPAAYAPAARLVDALGVGEDFLAGLAAGELKRALDGGGGT